MNRRYAWIIATVIGVLVLAFLFWPQQEPIEEGTTTPDAQQLGPAGAPEEPDTQEPAAQD